MFYDRELDEVQKVFKLRNGARITFHLEPPYGLWAIKWSKGPTPPELSGKYVTFSSAYKAAESYLKTRDHKTEILPLDEPL